MSKIFLRRAEQHDLDLLFNWANDPVVRSNSFNSDYICYENHVRWFKKMMNDSSVIQYILMDNDIPVGQIRLNVVGEEAEISYSIGAEYREKGYGRKAIQLVAGEIQKNYSEINCLIAKVKPENIASNKLFKSEGYDLDYTCYTLNIQRED